MIITTQRLLELGLTEEETKKYSGMHLNTKGEDISDEELWNIIHLVNKIKADKQERKWGIWW